MPSSASYKGKQGCLALGYRSEHFRIAAQMATAIGLGMLFIVINQTYEFLGEASVWIVISVVVAFGKNLGSAVQTALLAIAGSVVGAALGVLIIALLSGLSPGFSYSTHPITMSVWACVLIALVGFLLALNKERFPKLEVGFSIALLTYPIVAIPGKPIHPFPLMHYWMKLCRWLIMQAAFTALLIQPCFRLTDENYMERLKLSLCALIGVLLTVLAAAAVFPIRARTRLRKRTAKLLERMGNLAFYLLGEFCEDPDDDMRLPGSSGTDQHQHYVDDGLQLRYEGLHQMRLALSRDLIDMSALIGPAGAELRYLKLLRRKSGLYPVRIYRDINRLCGRSLTSLGNLHMYMEGGHMRLGLCIIHKELIEELRQDIAAAFTCLSGLVLNGETDESARETMERLCSTALEFQATMYSLPIKAEFNIHIETLAIFSKISTSVARQAASMYMEMRPEGGQRIHKAMCSGMERTSSKPVSLGDHSPSCARSSFGDSDCGRARNKENTQPVNTGQTDSTLTSVKPSTGALQKAWDVEQGVPDLINPSADPLLKLGRLPSISESSARPRLSFTLPSPPGPPLGPPHMRAMSFPGHLLIPGSAFGSHPAPPPGPGTGAGPPVPAAELQTALAAASLGNRSANSGSGPSDSASLPRRPTSKAFREMLQQQLAARSSEAEPEEDDHTDQRLPLGAPSLPLLPRASGPAKASSALGELGSGQGSGPLPGALPGRGSAVHAQQGGPPRLLQQGSGGLPYRSGSLPSQRSGSVHMQGDMQCGSPSDDDEDDAESHTASSSPYESCELCKTPSGIKDGKPSPWMWSRSTSFQSADNPF